MMQPVKDRNCRAVAEPVMEGETRAVVPTKNSERTQKSMEEG